MPRPGVRMPVLILSAKRSVDDRVRGLQAGSDDYLTKPFAFAELLAPDVIDHSRPAACRIAEHWNVVDTAAVVRLFGTM